MKRWIRASCPAQRAARKRRDFCPPLAAYGGGHILFLGCYWKASGFFRTFAVARISAR